MTVNRWETLSNREAFWTSCSIRPTPNNRTSAYSFVPIRLQAFLLLQKLCRGAVSRILGIPPTTRTFFNNCGPRPIPRRMIGAISPFKMAINRNEHTHEQTHPSFPAFRADESRLCSAPYRLRLVKQLRQISRDFGFGVARDCSCIHSSQLEHGWRGGSTSGRG